MIKQPTIPQMPRREKKDMDNKNNEWITIVFKNGDICHYKPSEYTDYYYDKKCFVVIRDKQWIGICNIDDVRYIEIGAKEE